MGNGQDGHRARQALCKILHPTCAAYCIHIYVLRDVGCVCCARDVVVMPGRSESLIVCNFIFSSIDES